MVKQPFEFMPQLLYSSRLLGIVSFKASLKQKCSAVRLLLKADTLYSLHVLQIARINERLENISSVVVKSSNSVFLHLKLFTGIIFINSWHIYKDQCCNGFYGRQTTVHPSLVFMCRLMLFFRSLFHSLSFSHLSLVQYAQLW